MSSTTPIPRYVMTVGDTRHTHGMMSKEQGQVLYGKRQGDAADREQELYLVPSGLDSSLNQSSSFALLRLTYCVQSDTGVSKWAYITR